MMHHHFAAARAMFAVLAIGGLLSLRSATAQTAVSKPPGRLDPAVETVVESNPTTPSQLLRAIETLLNLGAPEQAQKFLQRLISAKPDDAALVALHREYGSGIFFRLARDERVQPEGKTLADATLNAATRYARDPQRLAALVEKLNDPAPEVRRAAVVDLQDGHSAAIAPMVLVLANPARAADQARVRDALVQMGITAVEPLIGVISAPDDNLRAQAIEVLGRLEARRATPYLIRPYLASTGSEALRRAAADALVRIVGRLPSPAEAEVYLRDQVEAYHRGKRPRSADEDNLIELWQWDANRRQSVPYRYRADESSLVVAAKLATDLYALWPQNPEFRRLYLAISLESAKFIGGLDRPLAKGPGTIHAQASASGAAALEDVLTYGMKSGRTAAATGAAEVLAEVGSADLLQSVDGSRRPLVEALVDHDPRLRFAAAAAIMTFDPQKAYPGSSLLPQALGFLAGSAGHRRALVAHPNAEQAQSLAGILSELDYDPEVAYNGRQLLRLAFESPDYELILVSDLIDHPVSGELLQQLRRDRRTASLPVGLVAEGNGLPAAERKVEFDPLSEALPRPHDAKSLGFELRRLAERAGRRRIEQIERDTHAAQALAWLAQLAESPDKYGFYELLPQQEKIAAALHVPTLAPQAARALGGIGSPAAQRSLVSVASQNTLPLAQRQAAAAGFAAAVRRRGLLLTTAEIQRQYELYNQSEKLDAATQGVLGSLLDALEAPTQTASQPAEEVPAASPAAPQ